MRFQLMRSMWLAACLCQVAWLCGCGDGTISKADTATAEQAYQSGAAAVQQKNFSGALADLTKAIDTGLSPDMLVDALMKRAECHAEAGDFDKAIADLDKAEPGASDLDKLYVLRGIVQRKKGDEAAAKAAFDRARQLNPKAVIP